MIHSSRRDPKAKAIAEVLARSQMLTLKARNIIHTRNWWAACPRHRILTEQLHALHASLCGLI